MDKTTKIKIYFYTLLGIGLVWTLFVPKPYKNFAPIFFGLLTFPVFGFLLYSHFHDFSDHLRKTRSDLFQKYILNHGFSIHQGEIIDISSLFNNNDFDQLEHDTVLFEKYILCKTFFRLTLFSFILFPILAIGTIYIK